MAITTSWRTESDLVVISFLDCITGTDIIEALNQFWADERYHRVHHQVWDLSGIRRLDIGWGELKRIASMVRQHCKETPAGAGRIAIVAPELSAYSCARVVVAKTSKSGRLKKVFQDLGAAGQWIGMPIPSL